MRRTTMLILSTFLPLILFSGCTNQNAARVGNRIGKVLGKPLGVIATAGDEAFRVTGEIIKENVQQHRNVPGIQKQVKLETEISNMPEENRHGQIAEEETTPHPPQSELSQPQTNFWR